MTTQAATLENWADALELGPAPALPAVAHPSQERRAPVPPAPATLEATGIAPDQIAQADEGFVSIYSGVDFADWQFPKGHDGHWVAKDWVIAYDGRSAAEDKDLWTAKVYGDFTLILDWRWMDDAVPAGAPLPIRFAGAELPDEARHAVGSALGSSTAKDQWHRAIVTKRSGRLTIAVDGKIVLQNASVPGLDRSGRIALRHDGRSVEFANVFVRE